MVLLMNFKQCIICWIHKHNSFFVNLRHCAKKNNNTYRCVVQSGVKENSDIRKMASSAQFFLEGILTPILGIFGFFGNVLSIKVTNLNYQKLLLVIT